MIVSIRLTPIRIPRVFRFAAGFATLLLATKVAEPAGQCADDPVPYLARHIARMEGWWAGTTRVRKLNNPGALVFVRQPGAHRSKEAAWDFPPHLKFARFDSAAAGWDALVRDLRGKLARGSDLGRAWPYLSKGAPYATETE